MVEGFNIGVVGVVVWKGSKAECTSNEYSFTKCKEDRGDEDTHWDEVCFINDELMDFNSELCKLDIENKWLMLNPKYLMHQTQYIK